MERAFDRFFDVHAAGDADIVRLARSMQLDIAVDLGGFTDSGRPNVFAMRAAPLQAAYLGYLGTSGAAYMDYLLADATIVPAGAREHYTESIVYLPSYQPNDSKRIMPQKRFTRDELGLPSEGFVFCCFNAVYKITPATFDGWMRILSRVPGSTLLLLGDLEQVERNLRSEAGKRGVEGGRLVFGRRLSMPDYLARYRSADLFLDTLPYNAGTTASDALWSGLPVLTRPGETFAGRVAASLLTAIGLPELIASTQDLYESTAVELALDPQRLAAVRDKLGRNRSTSPLFDAELSARSIENAYTQMYERHQAGLEPEHLHVTC
jgi:predicted O-linked N-acetylglucosamine transferase (SPINDLY family)